MMQWTMYTLNFRDRFKRKLWLDTEFGSKDNRENIVDELAEIYNLPVDVVNTLENRAYEEFREYAELKGLSVVTCEQHPVVAINISKDNPVEEVKRQLKEAAKALELYIKTLENELNREKEWKELYDWLWKWAVWRGEWKNAMEVDE